MHRTRTIILATLLLAFVFAVSATRPASARVLVTDIGTINGRSSTGIGINHVGDVVGLSYFSGSVGDANGNPSEPFLTHAVLYRGGLLQDLGAIEGNPTCSPIGCQSEAFGVNDQDWVVGWTDNGSSGTLPFLWLPAPAGGLQAGFNVLPALTPDNGSAALAINNAGQMAGYSSPGGADKRAILWQSQPEGVKLIDLGTLRRDNTGGAIAVDINNLGQIVGSAVDERFAPQGFLYLPEAAYGLPAGMNNLTGNQPSAEAISINDRGEVVGVINGAFPFVWLPAPAHGQPAGFSALTLDRNLLAFIPTSIGDDGLIVGQAYIQTRPGTGEFVREAAAWHNGAWIRLNDLLPTRSSWSFFSAASVSQSGRTTRITGLGLLSGVTDVNGFTPAFHGYVLDVTCVGDLNDDGSVDQLDLTILRGQLGQSVPAGSGGDINGDGIVDRRDQALLTAEFGATCLSGGSDGSLALETPTAETRVEPSRSTAPDDGLALPPAALENYPALFLAPQDLAAANGPAGHAAAEPQATASRSVGDAAPDLSVQPTASGRYQCSYRLAAAGAVRVALYDVSGRLVKTLVDEAQDAGDHRIEWSAGNLPRGIYLVNLRAGTRQASRKVFMAR